MSELIKITINGKVCLGEKGKTILEIARENGIEIPNLCHDESVKEFGACGVCVVEGEGMPKLMRACSTVAGDGWVVSSETPRARQSRRVTLELLMSDHHGDCRGPCGVTCPAGTDVQGYIKQIALGNDREAVRIIKEKIPIPASIGRVCPHPCERECRRKNVESPVSIAYLKAFAADNDLASEAPYTPSAAPATGKRVAVVGGGPGGLTAAYYLALKGHKVTVYDAMPEMGGMLRYGIPEYRLPKAVLAKEIAAIKALGVQMLNDKRLGKDVTLETLRQAADAVVLATGAWKSSSIGCPGEEAEGVLGGIDFLRAVNLGERPQIGDKVMVVGGGNTAMDACRTAVRLGAREVYVVYRRTEAEMPAEQVEIDEAREEGVTFKFLRNPAEILSEDGHVKAVKLQVMELGEPDASGRRSPKAVEGSFETVEVSCVIAAIGQKLDPAGLDGVELNRKGSIAADESSFLTNLEGVFAVGDATNKGASIAIAAIGEAGRAAAVVDSYLSGAIVPYREPYCSSQEPRPDMFEGREKRERVRMPQRPAELRRHDFAEINLGLSADEARREAARCLECGCFDYKDCRLIKAANTCMDFDPCRLCGEKHKAYKERRLLTIERDQGKCILCGLCVRVCDEVVGKALLGFVDRGFNAAIRPEFNDPVILNDCRKCGKCAAACPTGALKIIG